MNKKKQNQYQNQHQHQHQHPVQSTSNYSDGSLLQQMLKVPRIGFVFFYQKSILIPTWKKMNKSSTNTTSSIKRSSTIHNSNNKSKSSSLFDNDYVVVNVDESAPVHSSSDESSPPSVVVGCYDNEWEVTFTLMNDITDDPFCPLPLDLWTYSIDDDHNHTISSNNQNSDDMPPISYLYKMLKDIPFLIQQAMEHQQHHQQQQQQYQQQQPFNCAGAALKVMANALQTDMKYGGGTGTLLTSTRPNYGKGGLVNREKISSYSQSSSSSSISEKILFTPLQQQQKQKHEDAGEFYRQLGDECVQSNVSLNIIMTTSLHHHHHHHDGQRGTNATTAGIPAATHTNTNNGHGFLDVATLSEVCRHTCGKFKWLKVEDSDMDKEGFYMLKDEILQETFPPFLYSFIYSFIYIYISFLLCILIIL
mmetsp:Transcript_23459/g.26743  ORF Transcript_23459/g.26743 Transcript_23459/m.26743 type:complete len:420 (+) Transcript_23459:243-1502(+)